MNLQERIEALETEFNEKIKALKAEAQREDKFPQDRDRYWYIDSDGEILSSEWERFPSEEHMLAIGNIFKTEDEAYFAVEKLKVEAELRKYSRPFDPMVDNFFMVLDTSGVSVDIWCRVYIKYQGTIYFESGEKVQQEIEEVGEERINKYIFGVEEQ